MRRDLTASIAAAVAFTLIFGVAYPLITTGVARVLFPGKADGSRVERDGETVGSELIAQSFLTHEPIPEAEREPGGSKATKAPDERYFQPRPSVTTYNPAGTGFSNLGPNNKELANRTRRLLANYLELEGPYVPGLDERDVPVDAVMTSASSVDPHISIANARIQANRVAEERRVPLERVNELIDDYTDERDLGFLGEPGVNVLELNLALDEETK